MVHVCQVAIALILLVLSLYAQDGLGATLRPTQITRNGSNSTTSPTTVSPSCSDQNVSLSIEASDEARNYLAGLLAKDTIRVIFIYFDLLVGNQLSPSWLVSERREDSNRRSSTASMGVDQWWTRRRRGHWISFVCSCVLDAPNQLPKNILAGNP